MQSVGTTAASDTIRLRGARVKPRAVVWAGAGVGAGNIAGIDLVSGLLEPAQTNRFFVAPWLRFGAALLWMNRYKKRVAFDRI